VKTKLDSPMLAHLTAELEEAHPYLLELTVRDERGWPTGLLEESVNGYWTFLHAEAAKQLIAEGVIVATRRTLPLDQQYLLRERMAILSDTYRLGHRGEIITIITKEDA